MTQTDIVITILAMTAIAIAAMIIQDGVHQQVAVLRYRQYRALVDEMSQCLHKLGKQNEALRAEIERLKEVETEAEEIVKNARTALMNYLVEAMQRLGIYYAPSSVLSAGYGDGKTRAVVGNPPFAFRSEIGYNTVYQPHKSCRGGACNTPRREQQKRSFCAMSDHTRVDSQLQFDFPTTRFLYHVRRSQAII